MQILSMMKTDFNIFMEYVVVAGRLIIGIGASITAISKFAEDCTDTSEDNCVKVYIYKMFWILSIVFISKREEESGMRMYSLGFGPCMLTPLITIGWIL